MKFRRSFPGEFIPSRPACDLAHSAYCRVVSHVRDFAIAAQNPFLYSARLLENCEKTAALSVFAIEGTISNLNCWPS